MKSAPLSAFLICVFLAAASLASEPNALRSKVLHDTVIQGYPCARGYAWFYPDGSLNECTVARPVIFGGVRVPRGSVIQLWPNGAARYLSLSHALLVAGYHVMGGNLPGSPQSDGTAFYPSGKLRSFYLLNDQTIQDVPCRGSQGSFRSTFAARAHRVDFYEDGKLQSCQLTQNYLGQEAGRLIMLPDEPVHLIAGR
jgi:hypothetical protein